MTITAKLFATLRLKVGVGKVEVETDEPITVRDLLMRVSTELDQDIAHYLVEDDETIIPGTMILVGGKNIHHLDGLDTVVSDGDVAIFPPAGGG
jgi:molybdopterin synthase sulfur carrier subunit